MSEPLGPSGLPPRLTGLGRSLVMGVVNVTPDSFSDGGAHLDPDLAIAHGLELVADGADLVDVGGESTRPGAARVPVDDELRRVLPVVRGLVAAGVVVSVDTMRARVAEAALAAGATMVNDVSGGLADEAMTEVVAASGAPYVLMHWRGHSADMSARAVYADVVTTVLDELQVRLDTIVAAGVAVSQVVVDPGLGFAKDSGHNWSILGHLRDFTALGRPVVVGASRKAFLGALLAAPDGSPRGPSAREDATTAVSTLAAAAGAWAIRVHAARPTRDAVEVVAAMRAGRS